MAKTDSHITHIHHVSQPKWLQSDELRCCQLTLLLYCEMCLRLCVMQMMFDDMMQFAPRSKGSTKSNSNTESEEISAKVADSLHIIGKTHNNNTNGSRGARDDEDDDIDDRHSQESKSRRK